MRDRQKRKKQREKRNKQTKKKERKKQTNKQRVRESPFLIGSKTVFVSLLSKLQYSYLSIRPIIFQLKATLLTNYF